MGCPAFKREVYDAMRGIEAERASRTAAVGVSPETAKTLTTWELATRVYEEGKCVGWALTGRGKYELQLYKDKP